MNKKESKNKAIILAAQGEFIQKGFDGAVMENIARMAEVSKRTLYKYYPTKEELFKALVGGLLQQAQDELVFPYDPRLSVAAMLKQILAIKISFLTDKHFLKLAKILISEQMKRKDTDPKLLLKFQQSHMNFQQWVRQCLKDGKIKSSYRSKTKQIADFFQSLVEGMVFWPLVLGINTGHTKKEIEQIKDVIEESFLAAFCP